MPSLTNNTVSGVATRMLRGVELVTAALDESGYASENWAYPVKAWGEPRDPYYCEIWVNGMDWDLTYWLLEAVNFSNPVCWPVLHFGKAESRGQIHDFDALLDAIFWKRRDDTWVKSGDPGIYNDTVWTYIREVEIKRRPTDMTPVRMEHASQEPVTFWISDLALPRERRKLQPQS